tara:strand:- start:11613 stop:11909 length:297 start_codon:yes stop_codon:yes gene_type:complete
MPRIKVTRTYVAHVIETTHVFMDVPEGRDPEDFILDIEADSLAGELLEQAEEDACIQYDNDDPEDGPVAREKTVFVGTDQCDRVFDWDFNTCECEVVE